MKHTRLIMTASLAFAFTFACCDKQNDCEKARAITHRSTADFCIDKDDVCWSCRCFNQGRGVQISGTTYSCNDMCSCYDCPDDPDCACEGVALSDAEECLTDEDLCYDEALALAQQLCNQLPI